MSNLTLHDFIDKSRSELNKITTENMVRYFLENNKVLESLLDIKAIRESLEDIEENVLTKVLEDNRKLRKRVEKLEEDKEELYDSISEVQRNLNKQDQYSRRNNIELSGIPHSVNNLEETVVKILNSVNIACHRLPLSNYKRRNNNCKRTICRFVSRKFCVDALKSRKN